MNFFMRAKYSAFLLLIFGLGVGFIGGYIEGKAKSSDTISSIKQSLYPIEEKGTSYTFIHPLLAYRTPEAVLFGDYISLKNEIQKIIDSAIRSGNVSRVSTYFRDLDSSRWLGINQNDSYYPASLLKVPVMIAYFKEAESNPSILGNFIFYNPHMTPNIPFDAQSILTASQSYSIQDLIKHMIVDSDNGATFTLLSRINQDFLKAVYDALGIPDPGDNSANYKISVRTYGLFFRVLYNATYLSPDYSEYALKLLSQTTFAKGLVSGVPKGTVVAHKYGEHVLARDGEAVGVELSDCGIIYYPSHSYLLCVMTDAADLPSAEKIITDISRVSYIAVAEQYPSS